MGTLIDELISIIVPAYNIQNYIGHCLDSILLQNYSNLEILVVNDGSSDGTGTVIDEYAQKDSRIRAIHKENGGVTSARLRGVAEATGDWIGFVDGDDVIEPEMYERLMSNAQQYHADISHCGYQMVFPNRVDYYYNTGRLVQQDKLTGVKDLLEGSFVEPGLCNKLFRRELFQNLLSADLIPTEIKINEDLLMNYFLFKEANLSVFEDICPYHYMIRKGSAATSNTNEHKLRDPLCVTKHIMNDCVPELQPVVCRKLVRQLISGATISVKEQPELIIPYQRECRKELRQRLMHTLRGKECGVPLKVMVLWAAVWPTSYRWVHQVYAKITGLDKIYDLG